jgi:PPM family protein phosphatase
MELSVATQTDVGRVRTNNEDAYWADADLGLFIVCDGMGGHNAGEVASQMACDIIAHEIIKAARARQSFLETGSSEDAEGLREQVAAAVVSACREIYRRSSKEPALAGMGTTCTLVLLCGHDKGIVAHVGDSRLYLARQQRLHQLTNDHTYVNELIRRGSLTQEQARNHPQGNVLSRALGVQASVAVETMVFNLDANDTYLLCTDGMHNYVADAKTLLPPMTHADIKQGLATLVKTALDRGGHDNVTGVAFRIDAAGRRDDTIAIDQRIAALKRTPLFAQLNYNELVRIEGHTQIARALAGQVIVREGDSGSEFYLTLSGDVDIEENGRIITTLKAGAHFGESALIEGGPRRATVRARTQVQLLVLRGVAFGTIVRNESVLAAKLLWGLTQMANARQHQPSDPGDYAGEAIETPMDVPMDDD